MATVLDLVLEHLDIETAFFIVTLMNRFMTKLECFLEENKVNMICRLTK